MFDCPLSKKYCTFGKIGGNKINRTYSKEKSHNKLKIKGCEIHNENLALFKT